MPSLAKVAIGAGRFAAERTLDYYLTPRGRKAAAAAAARLSQGRLQLSPSKGSAAGTKPRKRRRKRSNGITRKR